MTRVLPYSVRRVLSIQFIRETETYLARIERQLNAAASISEPFSRSEIEWFCRPVVG